MPLDEGGVVKVTLEAGGTGLEGSRHRQLAALLGIEGESAGDQERFGQLMAMTFRAKLHDRWSRARPDRLTARRRWPGRGSWPSSL